MGTASADVVGNRESGDVVRNLNQEVGRINSNNAGESGNIDEAVGSSTSRVTGMFSENRGANHAASNRRLSASSVGSGAEQNLNGNATTSSRRLSADLLGSLSEQAPLSRFASTGGRESAEVRPVKSILTRIQLKL
jgi:hypothetical protein